MAHVGYARAAESSEACKRRAVAVDLQELVDPIAATLKWGAMVRRAQENHCPQLLAPVAVFFAGDVTGAPGDEPAHAVPEDYNFIEGYRPRGEKVLEQRGK